MRAPHDDEVVTVQVTLNAQQVRLVLEQAEPPEHWHIDTNKKEMQDHCDKYTVVETDIVLQVWAKVLELYR